MGAPHPIWNVYPAPPEITISGSRTKMDDYVKEFCPRHGYKITISHSSSDKCNIAHYKCHRSGNPPKPKAALSSNTDIPPQQKPSKSIKIQCPFHLTAKIDSNDDSWTLFHVRIGHNHGPFWEDEPMVTPMCSEPHYPEEIKTRATRILQFTPRKQAMILEELDSMLGRVSAIRSSISPPIVDPTPFNKDLDLAVQFLEFPSEIGSDTDHQELNQTASDNFTGENGLSHKYIEKVAEKGEELADMQEIVQPTETEHAVDIVDTADATTVEPESTTNVSNVIPAITKRTLSALPNTCSDIDNTGKPPKKKKKKANNGNEVVSKDSSLATNLEPIPIRTTRSSLRISSKTG